MSDVLAPPEGVLDEPKKEPVLRAGFTVGIYDNGDMLLKFHGEELGMIELYGLLEFARTRIEYNLRFKAPSVTTDALVQLLELKQQLKTVEAGINQLCGSNKASS